MQIGGDLCRAETHGRRLPSLPTPGWTKQRPGERLCFVFCIWTARSSEVRTPLKNFSPHHNRFYLTQLPLSPNFTTSPSRLEEFYSVKQTSETNTSSFCNLCTLCVLTVAHFSFHDHCLTSLPLIGLKVPQGWDLIYFCILSAKSRSLHI